MNITKLQAREILDSRGNPTIEVKAYSGKHFAIESVPSGASTGKHEAIELRDGGKRYNGMGVLKACWYVNETIFKRIKGIEIKSQKQLDRIMIKLDGTKNKSKLGANAILGTSLAFARLRSEVEKVPLYSVLGKKKILPMAFFNVINGGKHADNNLAFQEFMIVPQAKTFAERLRMASETYHMLKKEIQKKYGKSSTSVGDEGGFAPNLKRVEEALELLKSAVKKAGYWGKVKFALDCAASEFYDKKTRKYYVDGKIMTPEKLLEFYEYLVKKYPIISIEDPFEQDEYSSWQMIMNKLGKKIQIVGDDLLVTNPERIRFAIKNRLCNAMLLKVNQIGTLSEAIESFNIAKKAGWKVMISHRSGETGSSFIADLCVGLGAGQIKSGAPCRYERLAKYNRLLEIEQELSN